MTTFCSPIFVTETDEAIWTDCTWSSGLMLANKATATAAHPYGRYPATRAEREALRAASGDRTGGSSLHDLATGILRRYGWALPVNPISAKSLLVRLARGDGAELQGLYAVLPAHYQRWDRAFAAKGRGSAHAVYVQGHDRAGNQHLGSDGLPIDLFWCDPLGRGAYRGEWIRTEYAIAFGRALWTRSPYLLTATMPQGSVK